ncbi:MAG: hypothetical protein RR686_19645, partial [Morganella sp. (in: enterobacteria)]
RHSYVLITLWRIFIFVNVQLREAAKRDVGNGENQLPDMSFFASGVTSNGTWFRQPGGIYVQSVECICPGTDPAGYRFQLPTSFPTQFVGAVLTPKDGSIGDITVSPTYLPVGLNAIQVYNFSGGGNNITAICFGY